MKSDRLYYEGRLVSFSRQGYPRVTWKEHPLKPNEAWLYVHRLEWYKHHGPIPDGYHVHHKDGNRKNWHIDNLELLTAAGHVRQHAEEKYGPRPPDLLCEKCGKTYYRLAMVEAETCRSVASRLGVSDTAIKKRLKKAGLW